MFCIVYISEDLTIFFSEKPPAQVKPKIEPKKGGKKYMKQMLKEKEEKERLQREEKIAAQLAKTPEDLMREKMEAQKLAEESDFEFAQELLCELNYM